VRDKHSSEILVMKNIELNMNDPCAYEDKLNECKVMKNIKHPNICALKGYF
jgi:hypothetical protein